MDIGIHRWPWCRLGNDRLWLDEAVGVFLTVYTCTTSIDHQCGEWFTDCLFSTWKLLKWI